jgi:hypothetical protein
MAASGIWPNRGTAYRRVYLFGNGLSLAFNREHYNLAAITRKVRDRLAGMTTADAEPLLDQLERIGAALRPDLAAAPRENFEEIAGPVDRLANALSDFGPLTQVASREQRPVLRELGRTLRALYMRVVGAVLECVMAHPPGDSGWGAVNQVADHLVERAIDQGELDVFCLNYDAILDSALLEARDSEYSGLFMLIDEFQGYDEQWVQVETTDEGLIEIGAMPWRWGGYTPEGALLRLHHLHGAGTWMWAEGQVVKARSLEDIRSAGLFSAWAEGIEGQGEEGQVEPVVILGDQKGPSVARNPFNQTYEAFAAAVSSAEEIVLAGFSFLDEPLNRTMAAYEQPGSRIIAVNPNEKIGQTARQALGLRKEDRLVVINEPLPDGLTALG